MVNKMEELRENAQKEVIKLDNALFGHDTISMMEIIAKSETKSMTEVSMNKAEKVEVFNLSEQQMMEKNLRDKVSHDDFNEHKPEVHDENEQLDDNKARTADVNSLDDPPVSSLKTQKDLNAKEEVEHNSDGTVDNLKEAFADDGPNINGDQKKEVVVAVTENDKEEVTANETFVMKTLRIFKDMKYLRSETFRIQGNDLMSFGDKEVLSEDQVNDDLDNTGSDNDVYMNVHAETLYASDRELVENVARDSEDEVRDDDEITAEEIDDQLNKLDVDILDNKDEIITVDVEGYSEAISEKPRMFSEVEIKGVGLMPQFENSSQENRVVNLDIIKNTLESGKDNKASKDEMDGCDGDTVIDEKIKSVKEEIDELEDMDGDHDETCEVTEEDEHDKSTDKNSVEAFGEKHNNADSDILETTIMEDSPDVIQVQFKGTFLENSEEIHTNLKKFFEVEVKEVASNDAYVHSTLEDLDNEKVILIEEVKGDREV